MALSSRGRADFDSESLDGAWRGQLGGPTVRVANTSRLDLFRRRKKRGDGRDAPQGCQTPAVSEPKYQTFAHRPAERNDLSTAHYTSVASDAIFSSLPLSALSLTFSVQREQQSRHLARSRRARNLGSSSRSRKTILYALIIVYRAATCFELVHRQLSCNLSSAISPNGAAETEITLRRRIKRVSPRNA